MWSGVIGRYLDRLIHVYMYLMITTCSLRPSHFISIPINTGYTMLGGVSAGSVIMTSRPTVEYCKWETFNASCRHDEVIVMTTARYGRMRFGRCMQEDHGSVGCSADVLPYLDRMCSGRHECHVLIPDATLHAMHTCPKELIPYLEASYECVKVTVGNIHTCSVFGGLPLLTYSLPPPGDPGSMTPAVRTEGYLSSLTASESPIGTVDCPWLIEALPGQRINITGYNFDRPDAILQPHMSQPSECLYGLVVVESNKTTLIPTCGVIEVTRQRHYYTSTTNMVKIFVQFFIQHEQEQELSYRQLSGGFLLRYRVEGCPDISWIANASIRRIGDRATITCNYTGDTYYVTCDVTRWLMDVINCTGRKDQVIGSVGSAPGFGYGSGFGLGSGYGSGSRMKARQLDHPQPLSRNLLLMVSVGMSLGVVLGIAILACVLIYRYRQSNKPRRVNCDDSGELMLSGGGSGEGGREGGGGRGAVWGMEGVGGRDVGGGLGEDVLEYEEGGSGIFPVIVHTRVPLLGLPDRQQYSTQSECHDDVHYHFDTNGTLIYSTSPVTCPMTSQFTRSMTSFTSPRFPQTTRRKNEHTAAVAAKDSVQYSPDHYHLLPDYRAEHKNCFQDCVT